MKKLLTLLLLLAPSVLAQNPVSGGPIPQSTYTTPPVLANPTHGTGAPTGTCMSGILYTNDSNGNLYSCNAGTWGLAGAAGTVTHTGNLTLNSMLLGNGVADAKIDTACVTNGTGALSGCTSISAGSGASSAGATATGGFACVEAASTGWTPTIGQVYKRCDNTLHNFVTSISGSAETPDPVFAVAPAGSKCVQTAGSGGLIAEAAAACNAAAALSALTAAVASNTIANGNNPQTWNFAQTTDSQTGITFGETSAATAGTLTNGLANQAEHSLSTATNSTATPFNITQGSITNTVATPLAQFRTTWNNSGLHGRGFGISLTNTASNADSFPLFMNVGNTTLFGVDSTGLVEYGGNASISSAPPNSGLANATGWRYCINNANGGSGTMCVASVSQEEYHYINGGGNGWLGLGSGTPNAAGGSQSDANAGMSIYNNSFVLTGKENSGCSFTVNTASAFLCGDSTTHEFLATTGGSSTLGMLVRRQPGAIRSTAKTAAVTTETTCAASAGACNVAGQYHVHFTAYQGGTACTTNTTGGITPTLTWTDGNGTAHTTVGIPMLTESSLIALSGTMLFNQTGSGIGTVFASADMNIDTNGTIIQDAVGFAQCSVAGTATYFYDFAVTRLQ